MLFKQVGPPFAFIGEDGLAGLFRRFAATITWKRQFKPYGSRAKAETCNKRDAPDRRINDADRLGKHHAENGEG